MADTMLTLSITAGAQPLLSEEDGRLLRGLRAGIEPAYEELLARYQQPVYGIVYRLLGDQNDAGDVVQEVFLKVFRGVHSFKERSSLRTWIYRIAVNEAHNHRRWKGTSWQIRLVNPRSLLPLYRQKVARHD